MFFARKEILFPQELAAALQVALKASSEKKSSANALNPLWEKLAKGRGQSEKNHYSFIRTEAEAYASYYLPANALKVPLVLEEALLRGMDITSTSTTWLDIGTGPGTAFWGLAWWFSERKKQLHFTGWDQSPVFTDLASSLTKNIPFPSRGEFLAGKKENALALFRKIKPTHLSFVNSLAEIFPDPAVRLEEMKKILFAMLDQSRKDNRPRFLLLLEPGSRESSRELAELKDQLLAETSAQVLLPCLNNRSCGALQNPKDWCHEEVSCQFPAWLNELGAAAGLRKEALLFSYVLFQVGGTAKQSEEARVVSQRLERKGQVECWLCTPKGKIFARSQRSKAGAESEPLLQACRGDIWNHVKLGEKGDLEAVSPFLASTASIFIPS